MSKRGEIPKELAKEDHVQLVIQNEFCLSQLTSK